MEEVHFQIELSFDTYRRRIERKTREEANIEYDYSEIVKRVEFSVFFTDIFYIVDYVKRMRF